MHPFHHDRSERDRSKAGIRIQIWLAMMEFSLEEAGHPIETRRIWTDALGSYLREFEHPGLALRREVRNYLYEKTEVGAGGKPGRSLPVNQRALAFFYEKVLPRPHLAEIARNPFLPAGDEIAESPPGYVGRAIACKGGDATWSPRSLRRIKPGPAPHGAHRSAHRPSRD